MRIISLLGSPHGLKGNTGRLLRLVLDGAESEGASGGGEEEPIAEYMNHFLITTGALPVGTVSARMSSMPEGIFTDELKEKAGQLGRRLVSVYRSSGMPEGVQERRQEFRKRMEALITYRGTEWPYEYEYWKKRWAGQ
ncbi:MAG: hypothetical protein M0Z60_15085 [Nitrospiraceae bacterium]|nr:hypothetical protein [Nitrospiraceae bacterium]